MRKITAFILAMLLLSAAAIAEADLQGMATDELVTLREAINHELATRSQGDGAQTVDVNGVLFSIDSVYIGTGNDSVPAICILLNVTNPTDASMKLINDVQCDILQDGMLLNGTSFKSDTYNGPSPSSSMMAVIPPGVVNMKVCEVGALSGDGENFTVILSKTRQPASVDPYCGTFTFTLSDYIND